jgi:hypothetical protein
MELLLSLIVGALAGIGLLADAFGVDSRAGLVDDAPRSI